MVWQPTPCCRMTIDTCSADPGRLSGKPSGSPQAILSASLLRSSRQQSLLSQAVTGDTASKYAHTSHLKHGTHQGIASAPSTPRPTAQHQQLQVHTSNEVVCSSILTTTTRPWEQTSCALSDSKDQSLTIKPASPCTKHSNANHPAQASRTIEVKSVKM